MLPIVIANPTQLTIVNVVPLFLGGAIDATNDENCGKSAATAILQSIYTNNMTAGLDVKSSGERKHKRPLIVKLTKATMELPYLIENSPLNQLYQQSAITANVTTLAFYDTDIVVTR